MRNDAPIHQEYPANHEYETTLNETGEKNVFIQFNAQQDDIEAAKWYRAAAEQGDALAQFNLGRMYHENRGGLTGGEAEAERLFKLAAEQEHDLAVKLLKLTDDNRRVFVKEQLSLLSPSTKPSPSIEVEEAGILPEQEQRGR